MSTNLFGGYGQAAHGRHQLGAASSEICPFYNESVPVDHETGVSLDQWITFTTYYYSSMCEFPTGVYVEISEDEGTTFEPAVAPAYELTLSVKDGQQIWIKVRKRIGEWPIWTKIVVRYTGPDEHGNVAVKTAKVRWSQ